ncbi:B-box zinc finger protein (macronuclear) [Tetrahymena thermophila SB210]|uniref:B-box zinc finger protein n=1 Tax=Tetrahymena thermophila (strain SB210) TaxID=312017 RepID=Q22Z92_TETTS|nr:B-box zinc finger protein [Tetrahymena thermophila SB210]EAR90429.2 B-box zinc finger protein [Tetrahymena thermophila SB210]|eukprot:XP_001010674.2 B-box zinc finger protein [Tetrahymena thermophila SB210]
MNLDASSLNIFCPEHNQYVQYVCLVNSCYQKLMCENCLKKHRDVHRNMHIPLMEMINNFKRFQKIKLEEEDNLSGYHEQIKNGSRSLRGKDSKPSEIDYNMMQCINGKDQEQKFTLFNEKSQVIKTKLTANQAKIFNDELQLLIQAQQKKILNFEKSMIESMQNQLKRATSRIVLEEKFIKESSIQVILDDLKNNNDRYNQLNRNLQKFHKGYLELKISKKIFRDMCVDTQQRFKIFSKNLSTYFDQEYNKLFSFMIDTNEAINELVAFEQQLLEEQQLLQSPTSMSPIKPLGSNQSVLTPDLSKQLKIPDKHDPNFQMNKMIEDLKKINQDIRKATLKTEVYAPDLVITQTDKVFSFNHESDSQLTSQLELPHVGVSQVQDDEFHSNKSDQQINSSSVARRQQSVQSKKKIQLSQIANYSPSQQQQHLENFNTMQKQELLQRVNFTKKEYKINLEKIENIRFQNIQKEIVDSHNQFNKQKSQGYISLKSLTFLYSAPNLSALQNGASESTLKPSQSNSSLSQSTSPLKKSVNFRITTQNTQKSPVVAKFIQTDSSDNTPMNNKQSQMVNKQLQQAQKMLRSTEKRDSFFLVKEQPSQTQSITESSVCYEMQLKSDYRNANILLLSVNPYLRAYGYLDMLKIPFQQFTHPFQQYFASVQSKQNELKLKKTGSQDQLVEKPKKREVILTRNENSYLINYQKEEAQQVIVGFENLPYSKYLIMHQNGNIQVWQLALSQFTSAPTQITKVKDYNIGRYIYCYSEVNENEELHQKDSNINTNIETDPIFIIGGQNELNESTLSIFRYESDKSKFLDIDSFKCFHGPGAISQMQVVLDKQFKKKNVPNSLQLITDVCYVFTLNLFDFNEEAEFDEQESKNVPTIQVQKLQFHRDKHGSTEKMMITKFKIKNNLIIQRIIYDQVNDCLWGHSDYMLFKWRINLLSKCLESQECITLCTNQNDVITSMNCNNNILMLSSLQGNIWGVDVMLNKVIMTDLQRIKYSSINHYNKIQGKDPIYIISGTKIYLTPNNLRNTAKKNNLNSSNNGINNEDFNKTSSSFNSTQMLNATNSSNLSKGKEQQGQIALPQAQSYFLYSTLSSSGVKVFCFDSEFKQVVCTLSGQENHLQQFIALNKENMILAVEDFSTIRMWKNEQL